MIVGDNYPRLDYEVNVQRNNKFQRNMKSQPR